jgi:hypothetical protein
METVQRSERTTVDGIAERRQEWLSALEVVP